MLASFVLWHLRIGFRRLYLYFDDPDDAGIGQAQKLRRDAARNGFGNDAVRVVPCDDRIRGEWASLTTHERWDVRKVEHHVEVRQLLNAEHGLRAAHADGDIDWLLHIDSDELFFIDDLDAAAHFGRLSAHGCVGFKYPIHEGCPEASDETNVFDAVTLFRTHPALLEAAILDGGGGGGGGGGSGGGGKQADDPEVVARVALARECMQFWSTGGRHYQLGSPQGKSATRVLPGALPMSVHTWYPPDASQLPKCWASFKDNTDAVAESMRVVSPMGGPCILHYISCSFSFWWHKYKLLGAFSNHKPGGAAVGGLIDTSTFHAQSRDLVCREAARPGREGRDAARRVYEATVCLLDAAEARRQAESRVCKRINAVQDVVRAARSPAAVKDGSGSASSSTSSWSGL